MSRDLEPVDDASEPVADADPDVDELDEEALHWAGDEARGQAAPRRGPGTASVAQLADDAFDDDAAEDPGDAPRRTAAERALQLGSIAFGVVYLAHSIGWIFSAQLLVYPSLDLLGEIMWQFGEFLSLVAPALWFVAALTLTPEGTRRRGAKRMLGLLVGALVLVPWPALLYGIASMS